MKIIFQQIEVVIYPDGRLDTTNAARYLGLKEKTLAMMRGYGTRPKFIKRGRIFYFKEDLDAWLNAEGRLTSTAQSLIKIDLIIIDNISTLCRNSKENEADSWLPVQEWALRMRASGKSILFIHHAGKGGHQRGTSKREDILDTVIMLKRPDDYKPKDGSIFQVHFEKARGFMGEAAEPFEAQLIKKDSSQEWVMRNLDGSSSYDEVIHLANQG